jgi:hypothetical protein
MNNQIEKSRKYFVFASLAVFILSLTQTAITYNDFDGQKTYGTYFRLLERRWEFE